MRCVGVSKLLEKGESWVWLGPALRPPEDSVREVSGLLHASKDVDTQCLAHRHGYIFGRIFGRFQDCNEWLYHAGFLEALPNISCELSGYVGTCAVAFFRSGGGQSCQSCLYIAMQKHKT